MKISSEDTSQDKPLSILEEVDCDNQIEKLKHWWDGPKSFMTDFYLIALRVSFKTKNPKSITSYRLNNVMQQIEERGEKYFSIPSYTYLRPHIKNEKHGDYPDSYGRYSLPNQIKNNHATNKIDQEENNFATPEELGNLVKECKEECTDYICVDLSGTGELFSEYRSCLIAATKENLDHITIICDGNEYKKLAVKQNKKPDGFTYIYV